MLILVAPLASNAEPMAGNGPRPDLAAAATKLGISEQKLVSALGNPNQGPPDFAVAAKALNISEKELTEALGTPENRRPRR